MAMELLRVGAAVRETVRKTASGSVTRSGGPVRRGVSPDRIGLIAAGPPTRIERVVLDFDGTFTRVDKEAVGYVRGYKASLARKLNITRAELERFWKAAKKTALGDPSQYGWKTQYGQERVITAPAYADPLVMGRTIAEIIFDQAGLLTDSKKRGEVLEGFFNANSLKMGTEFKPDAAEAIGALKGSFQVCVVTNSGTTSVKSKLTMLPDGIGVDLEVRGDAQKSLLDSTWDEVPESITKDGYGRPLYLRRALYWKILAEIMEQQGISPEQVAVVGDIYELDLLLPLFRGMTGVLTPRRSTPAFEQNAVGAEPRGFVANSLMSAVRYLETIRRIV